MCGIVAYIGNKKVVPILIEGLTILQNRGYDSVGIATINNKTSEIMISKNISQETTSDAIDRLRKSIIKNQKHQNVTIGIAHTRWSTHGKKSVKNSHPHVDILKRFAVVHNGVIENYKEIKSFLLSNNIKCVSETDTETIVQLIGYYSRLPENKNKLTEKIIQQAFDKLEGTWGLIILDKENPNKLYVARRGSPILIGLGKNEVFVASELSAFQKYTSEYIPLMNNEVVVIPKKL